MPLELNNEIGNATRVTTSGVTTMGAGKPVNLLGIWVASVLTAQIVHLHTQTGAAVLTGALVVGTSTLATNAFYRIPAYFATGLSIVCTNEDVDLTLFWNPGTGGT